MPVAIEAEHLPTEVGYDSKLQSGQDPGEDDEHADELTRYVFLTVQKIFGCTNPVSSVVWVAGLRQSRR